MSDQPLSVVVLGKGSLAIQIASWFCDADPYNLACIVPVVPEPSWTGSLIAWARESSIPYVASGDYGELEVPSGRIDLAFSVFYDRILSQAFIERCGRVLNLHNAPLPRYRGVSPINWALENQEGMHGVTIHEVTAGIDDGPIVARLDYPIYAEFDEVRDVYRRSLAFGWVLFEQTMPMLDQIVPRPQDERLATYFSAADNERLGERRSFTRRESRSGDRGEAPGPVRDPRS